MFGKMIMSKMIFKAWGSRHGGQVKMFLSLLDTPNLSTGLYGTPDANAMIFFPFLSKKVPVL